MEFISFNGALSTKFGLKVKEVSRPLLPEIRDHYEMVPGRHGSYVFPQPYGDRPVSVTFTFKYKTVSERTGELRNIAEWLHSNKQEILMFEDEPDVFYLAKIDAQPDPDIMAMLGTFTISFKCKSFKYSRETFEKVIQTTNNKAYGIVSAGTIETYPTVVIGAKYGDLKRPKITINDQTALYDSVLTNGSSIELNTEDFQASKSMERDIITTGGYDRSEDSVFNKIEGDFGIFKPGANTVVFSCDDGTMAEIKFIWKDLYLY